MTQPGAGPLHDAVTDLLASSEQRYTPHRRALVQVVAAAGRPLTIPEILEGAPEIPQSSAYRNVTGLVEAGVLRRIAGADDHCRFELAEALAGHHHHLVCASCGRVEDIAPQAGLERALGEAVRAVSRALGYEITQHRLDLEGLCPSCRPR